MTDEIWGQTKKRLHKEVGSSNFANWIEPLHFDGLESGVATFTAPTTFIGNWVSRNYSDHILRQLVASKLDVSRVEFAVKSTRRAASVKVDASNAETSAAPAIKAAKGFDDLPGASLDARFTF